MRVKIDSWARVAKGELDERQLEALRNTLTIYPRKVGDHPGPDPEPILCFEESADEFRMPRQFYLDRRKDNHTVLMDVTEGVPLSRYLAFNGKLEPDQKRCVDTVSGVLRGGRLGGLLRAVPGYGKTVVSLAIISEMKVPTLVLVHKEFLVRQWQERIARFLPEAQVGVVQSDTCDFVGKDIVLGMNQSLYQRRYPDELYSYFGMIVSDECHRVGAPTWSQIPQQFNAKWRLGLSATPHRADGCHHVFFHHFGQEIFSGSIERLDCDIHVIHTDFRMPETKWNSPGRLTSTTATSFLVRSKARNARIIALAQKAAKAGRRIMIMSSIRKKHIEPLREKFIKEWPKDWGDVPTTAFYLGGMKPKDLEAAEKAQVLFCTSQMAKEGLDIPPLDTLFLTTPMGNVEQAVGRIQRNFPGKKKPMVVDFRDDSVSVCRSMARSRWRFYAKKGWVDESKF